MAAIGLYGVISYLVGQRPREYGLRMALGASRADILKMVMSQGLGLVLGGVGIGLVGALLAARLMHVENVWAHDSFFAYVDRWMTEDDTPFIAAIKEAGGRDYTDVEFGRFGEQ